MHNFIPERKGCNLHLPIFEKHLTMTRVLFVCLGNICRSPLAEAIFNHQIREKGLEMTFEADSCGTANYHIGMSPDPRTIRNAYKNKIIISHLGRQFHPDDFEKFDLILAMDVSNRSHLLRMRNADLYTGKIKLMRSFDSKDKGADVPDPYHGDESDFQAVFEILNRSVQELIHVLETRKTN